MPQRLGRIGLHGPNGACARLVFLLEFIEWGYGGLEWKRRHHHFAPECSRNAQSNAWAVLRSGRLPGLYTSAADVTVVVGLSRRIQRRRVRRALAWTSRAPQRLADPFPDRSPHQRLPLRVTTAPEPTARRHSGTPPGHCTCDQRDPPPASARRRVDGRVRPHGPAPATPGAGGARVKSGVSGCGARAPHGRCVRGARARGRRRALRRRGVRR